MQNIFAIIFIGHHCLVLGVFLQVHNATTKLYLLSEP